MYANYGRNEHFDEKINSADIIDKNNLQIRLFIEIFFVISSISFKLKKQTNKKEMRKITFWVTGTMTAGVRLVGKI